MEAPKVQLLNVQDLEPHPLNPRPWSEKYQANVYDSQVEELCEKIRRNGFNSGDAITVRPLPNDKKQIIVGHHRWIAAKESGLQEIPCFVQETSDQDAAIAVIERQGKEIDRWSEVRHAYLTCETKTGLTKPMTRTDYASLRGKSIGTVSDWISAYKTRLRLEGLMDLPTDSAELADISIRFFTRLSRLDESDWKWMTEMLLENQWKQRQSEAALTAVNKIGEIPEEHHCWLNPNKWKKEAAKQASMGIEGTPDRVRSWIELAENIAVTLNPQRHLWMVKTDQSTEEVVVNEVQMFYESLSRLEQITLVTIEDQHALLIESLQKHDDAYCDWLKKQQRSMEQRVERESAAIRRIELQTIYEPRNLGSPGTNLSIEDGDVDVVFVDIEANPGVLTETNVLNNSRKSTKQKGRVIILGVDISSLAYLLPITQQSGYLIEDTWIWSFPNPDAKKMTRRHLHNCQAIVVCTLNDFAETDLYFNRALMSKYLGNTPTQCFSIPQVQGSSNPEYLDWAVAQKPLNLYKALINGYVPPGGLILDATAESGATPCVAAKEMGVRSLYGIDPDQVIAAKVQQRIESSHFPVPSIMEPSEAELSLCE